MIFPLKYEKKIEFNNLCQENLCQEAFQCNTNIFFPKISWVAFIGTPKYS